MKTKKILIYILIIFILYLWYYYLFVQKKDYKTNLKVYKIEKTENKKENKKEKVKINWSEDIKFSYCDNILKYSETSEFWNRKDFFNKEEVVLLTKKMKEYNKQNNTKSLPYENEGFPYFISEYCKTSDGNKYIFSAEDKRPYVLWIYDKQLDIIEPANFKHNIFDNISFWARTWNRNYWDTSLEKYYENYRKDKSLQSWFWKKNWNIVDYVNYGVSLIWHAEVWLMYWPKFLNNWNLKYCTSWLTPAWKLSVCFADVYYKYDLSTNTLYEDKICPYYIDDNWIINPLQKCFQNTWKYKWYNFVSWTDWIKVYQNESKELSIIDIDLDKSWISFWWVIQTNTKYLSRNYWFWYINKSFKWQRKSYFLQKEENKSNFDNFKRESIDKAFWESNFLKIWWNIKEVFVVVNGQFFNANKKNTTLSFPLKSNSKILNSYFDNDKIKRTIIIDNSWKVKIKDWYKEKYLNNTNNKEVLVWINPNENFAKNSSLWRTYMWIVWDDKVVFFIAKSKTQSEMKNIALNYGIEEQNLVMLDWWPSSQFAYFDIFDIGWGINKFYGWWEIPHFVMIYKK